MGRVMQVAAFSLAEVTYAVGGDIGYQIQSPFRMADKMDGVVMGGGLVDPSKYPVPIET